MPETLRAIVQEFVTRDGTDHSAVEERIAQVLRQIDEVWRSCISSKQPAPAIS